MVMMSGGVDSSVAAAVLRDEGHDVTGVTLKLWGGESDSGCCSASDVEDARRVAAQLGIPHYVFNFTDAFDAHVVAPYVSAYAALATASPRGGGVDLARAMVQLVAGDERFEVGPTDFARAVDALSSRRRLALAGAETSLDFDLVTGEVGTDVALVCPGVDAHGYATNDVESGVYARNRSAAIEGLLRCP